MWNNSTSPFKKGSQLMLIIYHVEKSLNVAKYILDLRDRWVDRWTDGRTDRHIGG